MHIKSLEVDNFRALRRAVLKDLPTMVVIAGPNGCGKSSLFDALRLIKSAYGGYQPNEWLQWFGEHQINLDQNQPELLTLFRDRGKSVRISVSVRLEAEEKEYLRNNAIDLMRPLIWQRFTGGGHSPRYQSHQVADQIRTHGKEVEQQIKDEHHELIKDIEHDTFVGELTIDPNLSISITPSPTLWVVFSLFRPEKIGIIDYHSAQRTYNREQIGGINLSAESLEQQYSQHALYNFPAKYQNIKTQMAASYIRELLEREAGSVPNEHASLIDTLKEMFKLFFPDKQFLGPVPTEAGKLLFPVRSASGSEHDINDLSSGEKEVLYGYLRLRNVSPSNSVLLLDEPELHLNPRLIQGLPQFYHRHLGVALNNQVWLLTHSDALLREAVGQKEYAVFHMQAPSEIHGDNQMHRVAVNEDLDRALVDLVGDLATYRPGAKVVIFEGGGDTEFDVTMVSALFPEFATSVNLISGTNKGRVRQLHILLEKAASRGALHAKFFSIVDRDSDDIDPSSPATALSWRVYHIENYLLEPKFILSALRDALGTACRLCTEAEVLSELQSAAGEAIGSMVKVELERLANHRLVTKIKIGCDPNKQPISASLKESISGSKERFESEAESLLSSNWLEEQEHEIRSRFEQSIASGRWKSELPGRDILTRFVGRLGNDIKYDVLRNLVIASMRNAQFQPRGMKEILDAVLAS